ncbi:MAG TPA: tetratricopeptide repeat protein, partial [Methanospirillum sp.]|uniref:tetratricopeptide repeat protein n=1 Tax=Methanospirillum sp. TaxID=45200 RepID=UPI002C6AB516
MSHLTSILFVLAITLIILGSPSVADVNKTYYNGYSFDPELVPSGMIPYQGGWSHGLLFSAPNWLLAQIDQNLTSTVLDRGVTPTPTPVIASDAYETYMSEGFAALEGGDYRAAYTAFQAATELKPDSSDAWYGLGIALESQKRFLSALDAYTKAISYAKEASSNWASYAGKGRVLYALNRFTEAKTTLETALEQYD